MLYVKGLKWLLYSLSFIILASLMTPLVHTSPLNPPRVLIYLRVAIRAASAATSSASSFTSAPASIWPAVTLSSWSLFSWIGCCPSLMFSGVAFWSGVGVAKLLCVVSANRLDGEHKITAYRMYRMYRMLLRNLHVVTFIDFLLFHFSVLIDAPLGGKCSSLIVHPSWL
jgi:hypothetical protein